MRDRMICDKTLFMQLSSVIPRQFSHFARLPFFGSFIIRPSFQLEGKLLLFQLVLISGSSRVANMSGLVSISSGGRLSGPAAFPLFSLSIADFISDIEGAAIEMCLFV